MTTFVAGDTGSAIQVTCIDNVTSAPINLTDYTVNLKWVTKSNVQKSKLMTIVNAVKGTVFYQFVDNELESPSMNFDVVLTGSTGKIVTCKDIIDIIVRDKAKK